MKVPDEGATVERLDGYLEQPPFKVLVADEDLLLARKLLSELRRVAQARPDVSDINGMLLRSAELLASAGYLEGRYRSAQLMYEQKQAFLEAILDQQIRAAKEEGAKLTEAAIKNRIEIDENYQKAGTRSRLAREAADILQWIRRAVEVRNAALEQVSNNERLTIRTGPT